MTAAQIADAIGAKPASVRPEVRYLSDRGILRDHKVPGGAPSLRSYTYAGDTVRIEDIW